METHLNFYLELENRQSGLGNLYFYRSLPALTEEANKFFHDLVHTEQDTLKLFMQHVLLNELREYMLLPKDNYFRRMYTRCIEAETSKYLLLNREDTTLEVFLHEKIIPHQESLRADFMRNVNKNRTHIEHFAKVFFVLHHSLHVSEYESYADFFNEYSTLLASKAYECVKRMLVKMFEKDMRLFVSQGITDSGDYDVLLLTNRATLWTGVLIM